MYVTLGTYSLEAYAKGLYVLDGKDYGTFDAYMTALKKATDSALAEGKKARDKKLKRNIKSERSNLKTGLKIAGIVAAVAGLGIASYKIAQKIKDHRRDKINFYYQEVVRLSKLRETKGELSKQELEDLARYTTYLAKQAAKEDKNSTLKNAAKLAAVVV